MPLMLRWKANGKHKGFVEPYEMAVSPAVVYTDMEAGFGQDRGSGNFNQDVVMRVSDDGLYLNIYYVYAGSYIASSQLDCLAQAPTE